MKDGPKENRFNEKAYQHPHQDRVCGYLAEGLPCSTGPDGQGRCNVQSLCSPWYDGTLWHCTRPKAFGNRCREGPIPDPLSPASAARCPHERPPCRPVRSLRSKRRLVTAMTATVALGVCLFILGGSSGDFSNSSAGTTAVMSPGPLSAHHATVSQGCSACHSAATRSPLSLLSCAFGGSGGIRESYKCLNCHRDLGKHALQPHSADPTSLLANQQGSILARHSATQLLSRLLTTRKTTESGQLACATCHQEHRGAAFDLTSMTNAQCQSCHTSTFHSLSDGHPEFPERKRADLHFDHVTHMTLHFHSFERLMPNGSPRMQCSDCHTPDSSGSMMRLASFEFMCASCHGPQIRDHDSSAPARLHDLVFIEHDVKRSDRHDASPFMEFMLGDKSTDSRAVDQLVKALATDGAETVRRRLHLICDQSTESATIEACVTALRESHFFAAISAYRASLQFRDESDGFTYGNWRLTIDKRKIVYDCRKHADPVVKAWIDLLAGNVRQYPRPPATDEDGLFDRFFRDMIGPESTGRCLKCHSLDTVDGNQLAVNWHSQHGHRSSESFTHFSHKPHLTLLSNEKEKHAVGTGGRCETCHALNNHSFSLVNQAFLLDDGMPSPTGSECSATGVTSVRRQHCARCHQRSLAGDNCLLCHNYHVHKKADMSSMP